MHLSATKKGNREWFPFSFFLRRHAGGGAEGGEDGRGNRCNDLHDKLDGFFLAHSS